MPEKLFFLENNPKEFCYSLGFSYFCSKFLSLMKVRYITEKDFVPTNISHAKRHTEIEDGLFQIVYGVMQGGMKYDSIYDLIVRLSKEQENVVVKRFKLLAWKVEVEAILTKLRKYEGNDFLIYVVIPFTEYVEDVPYTMNLFQLVLYTINEILKMGDSQMTTIPEPSYDMPPKSITNLIEDDYNDFMNNRLPEEMAPDKPYYRSLYLDEMIRRGMTNFKSDEGLVLYELSPSPYFNQPEKLFDILDLATGEDWKLLKTKSESEELDDSGNASGTNNTSDKNGYMLGTVGTVFFMLKDMSKEAVDKKNRKKLVALMNYILDNKPDDDTARSYIDKLFGVTAKSHSFKFYNWVKNNLGRFGFEIPEVVKEGWEKSRGNH